MPKGKPAGIRCVQLDDAGLCRLFGQPQRPVVCVRFRASPETCGTSADEAYALLVELERLTDPGQHWARAGRGDQSREERDDAVRD